MVIPEGQINNIMGGMQETAGIRLNNHKHKLRHRFDIVKKLGQGTYGKVQLAINKETGEDVAIKTIKKAKIETEKDLIRIRREIQIMSSVTHPHIIHIFEVFENRDKMVLVMEYAAGGELYDYLSEKKVLSDGDARRIFRQVASACYYCHKHKICHRDLKLENILLDEYGNAKIADFGLSNVFDDSRLLSTYCGSPLYASPEIVRGTPYIGPEVDCWSLGVLLYTLVYGAMPFDGSNFKKLVKQITAGDFYEPQKKSTASELVHALLTPTPQQRATMLDVCGHWWVNQEEEVNCLEAAEELANQTPVRLDLLLSLAPQEPDKEHVMAQPAEAIVPPAGDKEPSQSQFGASDSLSLASAMELEPAASSPAVLATSTAEPAADKAAKRALDDGEEKAARKAEKAKKREGEKVAKKKKRPPSEPALPEEDVSMGEVAESAAAAGSETQGGEEQVADDVRQGRDAVTAPETVAPADQRSPAAAAPEVSESRPESEQGKPEEAGPTEEDFPAVEAPQLSGDTAKNVPSATETVLQDDTNNVGLEGAAEGEVVNEPSVQPLQPQPTKKESDTTPPTNNTESILDNNVAQEGISKGKPAEGPVHTSSTIYLKLVEPKAKDIGGTLPVKDAEVEPCDPEVVSTRGESSEPTQNRAAPSKTSEPKKSAKLPAVSPGLDGGDKVSGQKSEIGAGVPETVLKEQSPTRTNVERAVSPKKSRIPVIDPKLSDSQAKRSKAPQEPIAKAAVSTKEPQLSVKKPSSSQSDEAISPSKKPARSPSDMKQDVPAPTRKRTPPKEDGEVSAPKAKDETVEPEDKVKDKLTKPARIVRPCMMEEKEEKKLPTPEEKPKDKVAKPAEKPKDNVIKPAERSADEITAPSAKSKAPSPKPEEKPKPKLVKPEEKTKDKTAEPSEKVTERRSPARSSAERVPSASSVTSGIRPSPVDTRAPPATAAAPRLSRVSSEEAPRPAAPADHRAHSLPPRRAASKEYIIPIRLVDDEEEVKPATRSSSAPAPVSAPATPAATVPTPTPAPASAPAPAPAPAHPRRQKPVSHTSSLRSLPEDLSSDEGGSGGGAADELPPPARELLRKSPREFIIPIALEGGGTMTPTIQAQTKEQDREQGNSLFKTHQLSGQRRLGSLLGERSSRDELWGAPLGLKRLSSMRCFDDRPMLEPGSWPSSDRRRLSRARMTSSTERADSLSSGGEDDDDDDQFDFFTAESLFGNLMDRMKSLTKRIDSDENLPKRSLLLSDPLRMDRQLSGSSSSQRGHQRMPGLWGMHGQVKSLFDKPMTFPHGSLFDQPAFSRPRVFQFYQHSSFGSHPAAAAESSDSGGSQHEDEPVPATATGTRHKTTTIKKAASASTPPKKPGEYFWRPSFDGSL